MSSDPRVGAVAVLRDGDSVLVVYRSAPPSAGVWAFPGGKVEPGEPARTAALRELREETGLSATPVRWLDPFDAITDEAHYVLLMLLCTAPEGQLCAGDDAGDARWVTLNQLGALPCADGVLDYARAVLGG